MYAASMKTKTEGMLANAMPGSVKGAMHEKMARPLDKRRRVEISRGRSTRSRADPTARSVLLLTIEPEGLCRKV